VRARVWGTQTFDGRRDHQLEDGDVVEIHARARPKSSRAENRPSLDIAT
jgi:hypothetical protein